DGCGASSLPDPLRPLRGEAGSEKGCAGARDKQGREADGTMAFKRRAPSGSFLFRPGGASASPRRKTAMAALKTVPIAFPGLPESAMLDRARDFRALMTRRRTVR